MAEPMHPQSRSPRISPGRRAASVLCHVLSGVALVVALASCTTWAWSGGADYSGDPEARREAARERDRAGFAALVFGLATVGLHMAAHRLGHAPREPG